MPAPSPRTASRVSIRAPRADDAQAFVALARASRALHGRWVQAPASVAAFRAYLRRATAGDGTFRGFVVTRRSDHMLVGVFNLSEIVRGAFANAYLGYYAFAPAAAQGYMSEGLARVLARAFGVLRLHRVEANVQPGNVRSIEFLVRNGFTREGYSRRYLRIGGRWRDHVRLAIIAEDWRARRR
jgi:[ribosomal protein S5]-alanine N-acetyltransferase